MTGIMCWQNNLWQKMLLYLKYDEPEQYQPSVFLKLFESINISDFWHFSVTEYKHTKENIILNKKVNIHSCLLLFTIQPY